MQIWVFGILVPVNAAAIFFVFAPLGGWIALLAIGGMVPNLIVMALERGFSRTMALPHLVFWPPLVALILWLLGQGHVTGGYRAYLIVLLVADVISLIFDVNDVRRWVRGDKGLA